MNDKHYDKMAFNKILKLNSDDPFEAKKQFGIYLQEYPYDYAAYAFYASILIKIGKYEDAENILDYVENLLKYDTKIQNNVNRIKHINKAIDYSRIKLLLNQEKYAECYDLYLQDKEYVNSINLGDAVVFYCQMKLGIGKKSKNNNSYLFGQMSHYEEDAFREHIKKHLADYAKDMENPSTGIFCPDFPIDEVIGEIKKYIPSHKKICSGFYDDEYIFKYDENGRNKYKMTDYFKVICFHNTCHFITMTPSLDCEKLPYIDLNYFVKSKEDVKVKKLSQIDKFYQKYKNYK